MPPYYYRCITKEVPPNRKCREKIVLSYDIKVPVELITPAVPALCVAKGGLTSRMHNSSFDEHSNEIIRILIYYTNHLSYSTLQIERTLSKAATY